LRGIREGNGLAHSIVYGGDESSQKVAANLGAITGDLRQIMADLRAGKGTLGALLVDPSIYEDVKSVLATSSATTRFGLSYDIRSSRRKAPRRAYFRAAGGVVVAGTPEISDVRQSAFVFAA